MSNLNIPNLDRLISHLEGLPEERFTMRDGFTFQPHDCGTASCIHGHAKYLFENENFCFRDLGMSFLSYSDLTVPYGWRNEGGTVRRYPLSRAIRTLKHMRSEYLRTGEVVVDWDAPEPVTKAAWTAPQAVEQRKPALPAEIVRFLSPADLEVVS